MKKPYKVMALSTLIATIAAGSITPSYASAAENTTKPAPIYADAANNSPEYPDYSLTPEGLKDALEKTGSNMLVMDLYALTILKQGNVNFDGLTAIKDDLKTSITKNIDVSKENAKKWLDNLKPQVMQTTQNVIGYDTTFQNYYTGFEQAIKDNNKDAVKEGLSELIKDIEKNKAEADSLVKDLQAFRTKLTDDTGNFESNSKQIGSILDSENGQIPQMRKQIETNYQIIDENNKLLIASSVGTGVGVLLMASPFVFIGAPVFASSVYGTVTTKQQIDQATETIKQLTEKISNTEAQVARLTLLQKNTTNLKDTVSQAADAAQRIADKWGVIGAKYKTLREKVDAVNPNSLYFVKSQLNTAKGSWTDVRQVAENLQKSEIKYVEEKK